MAVEGENGLVHLTCIGGDWRSQGGERHVQGRRRGDDVRSKSHSQPLRVACAAQCGSPCFHSLRAIRAVGKSMISAEGPRARLRSSCAGSMHS